MKSNNFIYIKTATPQPAAKHLAQTIQSRLIKGQHVLWLVSGGSAIQVATATRRQLTHTEGLTVMQVDERFGPVGHKDSNWQKLLKAGFDVNNIEYHTILIDRPQYDTILQYGDILAKTMLAADFIVGLFGIGPDGHTAGILPNSPAVSNLESVIAYQGPDFNRITITPHVIAKLDMAIVYALGSDKAQALVALRTTRSITQQPAQSLKQIPQVYVYNDQVEDIV